jgi:diaminopimelate decarboxylase
MAPGECAARAREKARIALRVNPDVPANTHPYISTGLQQHKFGIPISKARKLYAQASGTKYLKIAGVSVHIGSQITDVQPFALAMERVAELVSVLKDERPSHRISSWTSGGGSALTTRIGMARQGCRRTGGRICGRTGASLAGRLIDGSTSGSNPGADLHRVARGRSLLTRVLYRKTNGPKQFLVVDAAMNDLFRPSLYDAYHEIIPAQLDANAARHETVDVGRAHLRESGDFFCPRPRVAGVLSKAICWPFWYARSFGMALGVQLQYAGRRPAEVDWSMVCL